MVDNSDATLTRDEIARLRRMIWNLSKLTTERGHTRRRSTDGEQDNEAGKITLYCSFCGQEGEKPLSMSSPLAMQKCHEDRELESSAFHVRLYARSHEAKTRRL